MHEHDAIPVDIDQGTTDLDSVVTELVQPKIDLLSFVVD